MKPYNKERFLNQPNDVSEDYKRFEDFLFVSMDSLNFNEETGKGEILWREHRRRPRYAFGQVDVYYEKTAELKLIRDFNLPKTGFNKDTATLPFQLSFVSPRTIRLRVKTTPGKLENRESLMIEPDLSALEYMWDVEKRDDQIVYSSEYGQVVVHQDPWKIEIKDKAGKLITSSHHMYESKCLLNPNPTPFSFSQGVNRNDQSVAATFTLSPDEKIFGGGESFTRLNKRGQKLHVSVSDPLGAQTTNMYKPVPFFMSNKNYGMFLHTSAPSTFDFGHEYDANTVIYSKDEELDLFIFIGEPKEVLKEYTALTGKSPVPPLWSFGLWMSRITYDNEKQVREVANKLREHKIPADVVHIDTGWFEHDWRCDYKFSESRFDDPEKLLRDLKEQGYRTCLWQLPYFTKENILYNEIIENGYGVLDENGQVLSDEVVLDLSNPEAVKWYQEQIAGLLEMGVDSIKVDFGEAAPYGGRYASGKSGKHEHNLYPLRYNKAVSDITMEKTGDNIIWARSAWAGSQRYPLHWGGDAEPSDNSMAASLRAGLSLGLCGFTYWSHDIGGYSRITPENLYRRWLPFGLLSSHSRCHGAPPTEPWEYGEDFMNEFREMVELRYELMPYVYTQANVSSENGYPMIRTMFFEFPNDPTAWLVEDQYMFGSDLLVAPLMEETKERNVYLPAGEWVNYLTGETYGGNQWIEMRAEKLPVLLLVRAGAVLPKVAVAQNTKDINWDEVELHVYSSSGSGNEDADVTFDYHDPIAGVTSKVNLEKLGNGEWTVGNDPSEGRINWKVVVK